MCFFKYSQNFIIQSFPLNTWWPIFMSLNDDIVDIEKSDAICSTTFDVDDLLGLLLHPSNFILTIQKLHR